MENIEKNISNSQKIESAKKEILRLRNLTREAVAAGKTQADDDLLQYAKDFETVNLSLIGEKEADLLDRVMHATGERAYEEFTKVAGEYRENRIFSLPEGSLERESLAAFFNYIANRGSAILNREE